MKLKIAYIVMLVAVMTSMGAAQTLNWNITGTGARAEGLGGAFIGVADDATAITWNPAGLGQLERTEVSTVGRYIMESTDNKNNLFNSKSSNSYSHFNFNFGSIAVPFKAGDANIVLAGAYQSQLDFYFQAGPDSVNVTGVASTVTPGVAIRLGSVFSIGAAANIWIGSADYSEKARTDTSTAGYSFSGLNFVGGILLDFSGLSHPVPIKLGVTAKTPFTLSSDINATFKSGTSTTAKATWEIDMPLMIGAGASVQIGQNFTLAADYEMRMFKDAKSKLTVHRTQGDTALTSNLSDQNDNLSQVRVGAEYLIVMSGGVIPLRVGFHTVPTLNSNYSVDSQHTKVTPNGIVSGIGFSAGTGFISGSFALDFAYCHDQWEQDLTEPGKTDFSSNYAADRISASLIVYF